MHFAGLNIFIYASLLIAVSTHAREVKQNSILFVHGNAVGLVEPRRDVALGTQASWAPSSNTVVLATSEAKKQLVLADIALVAGVPQVIRQEVLPIPEVDTAHEVSWKWSFSQNERWLIVERRMFPLRLHTSKKEAKEIYWFGLVDLASRKALRFDFIPFIYERLQFLGWRGDKFVFLARGPNRILEVDAANPTRTTIILDSGFYNVHAFSRDGQKIIVQDGRNCWSLEKLINLETPSQSRVLQSDDFQTLKPCGDPDGVYSSFSQDSKWLAINRSTYNDGNIQVSVSVESIDGKIVRYQDNFLRKEDERISWPRWSPAGPDRVFYFRPSDSVGKETLVVVELDAMEARTQLEELRVPRLDPNRLKPLWSPDGNEIAWLSHKNGIIIYNIGEKSTRKIHLPAQDSLGHYYLPDDTNSWTWAPTAVNSGRIPGPRLRAR